jgi:hypothetical protein
MPASIRATSTFFIIASSFTLAHRQPKEISTVPTQAKLTLVKSLLNFYQQVASIAKFY